MHPRYHRTRQVRVANKKSNSWLSWFFAFILGYLSAYIINLETLVHWANQQSSHHHVAVLSNSKKSVKDTAKIAQKRPQNPAQPKYEFYTMLQQNDGEIVQPDIKVNTADIEPLAVKVAPVVIQPPIAKVILPVIGEYVVQIAAFSRPEDAEALRIKLLLKGYQLRIVSVVKGDITVYRVISQDFVSAQAAAAWLQKLFTHEHLHGILRQKKSINR